jgi:hypothetical protein
MNRWLIIFLVALTTLRLFLGAHSELSPDEAYYYQWSQRLDWAYYSKGPLVAVAIRAGTALFGPSELGVRVLSPLLSLGTSLVLWAMARRLYGDAIAAWTVVFINLTPIFQAGSLVMTIDPLSIFFWCAAMWAFWLALERSPAFSWYWPVSGFCVGLGFLAKYTNGMELISMLLVLLLTDKFRAEFKRPGFWVMLGVALLAAIPPIVWNAQHEWITVDHLRARGGLDQKSGLSLGEFFMFFVLHLGVYSPLVFLGIVGAAIKGVRDSKLHFRPRFLVLFGAPLVVMYFLLAFKRTGEPNWTAPAFVSLAVLTVAVWYDWAKQWKAARIYAVSALVVSLLVSLAVVNSDAVRMLGFRWPYAKDPGTRVRGWKTLASAVGDIRQRLENESGKPLFLIGNKYQTSSSLAFYLPKKPVDGPGHPPVYIPESQDYENQYSFWPRYDQMITPEELAKGMLAGNMEQAKHDALATALAAVEDPKAPKEGPDADEHRRALVRALLAADPSLPLDEYASEEAAVSLFHGRDALYITDHDELHPPTAVRNAFESTKCVGVLQENRRGLLVREFRVFVCRNYHSLPL